MAYDDYPNLRDRFIAALIAMPFAVPMGWGIETVVNRIDASYAPVFRVVLLTFAIFGFCFPRRSRDFLTHVWHGIIGAVRDLRLWWW